MEGLNPLEAPSSKHILVADDSPDNLLLTETILTASGYRVSTAVDGYDAIAKVEQLIPDLILLDVMMPGLSGYEVSTYVRQHPSLPLIPILFVTASSGLDFHPKAMDSADALIRKPFDINELLMQVETLLANSAKTETPGSKAIEKVGAGSQGVN